MRAIPKFCNINISMARVRIKPDTQRYFLHLRHRTQLNNHWAAEGFVQTGKDRFARLKKQRSLLGGGGRLTLFNSDAGSTEYWGIGAFGEHEKLTRVTGTHDALTTTLWRGSTYLFYRKQFNDAVSLNNTSYYQPSLERSDDYRLLEQLSVHSKFTESLGLKLSIDLSYDSRPAQTVEKYDLFYSAGMEMRF